MSNHILLPILGVEYPRRVDLDVKPMMGDLDGEYDDGLVFVGCSVSPVFRESAVELVEWLKFLKRS